MFAYSHRPSTLTLLGMTKKRPPTMGVDSAAVEKKGAKVRAENREAGLS
jgi:hypothetical protein